jgi:hypothetical protein
MKSMFKGAFGALIVVLALSGLTAASALAAGAPIVQTKAATSVTGTEARLNGTVAGNGNAPKYFFEYGTTTSYGSRTKESTGAKELELSVWANVSGLEPRTTYHFRIVATNTYGTSYGADEVFTTPSEKPEFAVPAGHNLTRTEYSGSEGGGTWIAHGGQQFSCRTVSMKGKVTGPKTVLGKFVFSGCESRSLSCRSEGGREVTGEIETAELKGSLVYISKTAKTLGLVFKPASGELVDRLNCSLAKSEVRGGIVVPIGPGNVFTKSLAQGALEVARGAEGTYSQVIKEYETQAGKARAELEWNFVVQGGFQPMGWQMGATALSTNQEVEIEA